MTANTAQQSTDRDNLFRLDKSELSQSSFAALVVFALLMAFVAPAATGCYMLDDGLSDDGKIYTIIAACGAAFLFLFMLVILILEAIVRITNNQRRLAKDAAEDRQKVMDMVTYLGNDILDITEAARRNRG